MTGDGGSDIIDVNLTSGSWFGGETLVDVDGGAGDDTIVIASTAIQFEIDGSGARASNLVRGGDGNDFVKVTLTIEELAGSNGEPAAENRIDGGDGDDIVTARIEVPEGNEAATARNVLFGGAGNDVLDAWTALGGNELSGGAGSDILRVHGGGGATLDGGAGEDTLYGDFSADIFVLRPGEGRDFIFNFGTGFVEDRLGLSGGLTFGRLEIRPEGAGGESTSISAGGEELAILIGVSADDIDASDFILI